MRIMKKFIFSNQKRQLSSIYQAFKSKNLASIHTHTLVHLHFKAINYHLSVNHPEKMHQHPIIYSTFYGLTVPIHRVP